MANTAATADKDSTQRQTSPTPIDSEVQTTPEVSASGYRPAGPRWNSILPRAQNAPQQLAPNDILALQRSVGNRAVQQMLLGDQQTTALAPPHATESVPSDSVQRQIEVQSQSTSPLQVSTMPVPTVQRFITREAMIKLAGAPSWKAQRDESTYVQILNLLDAYQKGEDTGRILKELITLSQSWLDNHEAESPRGRYITGLKSEAETRLKTSSGVDLEQELSLLKPFDVVRSMAFWPGEKFGDEEPFLCEPDYGSHNKVWSTGITQMYMDPDLDAVVEFTKVKLPMNEKLVIG